MTNLKKLYSGKKKKKIIKIYFKYEELTNYYVKVTKNHFQLNPSNTHKDTLILTIF